jgi:hypothetical protein
MTDFAKLGFDVNSQPLTRATKELNSMSGAAGGTEKRVSSLGKTMLKYLGGAAIIAGTTREFRKINDEVQQLERNMLRTEAIIQATGGAAGFTADQLREQARALAFATLESTEGIMKAQQVLLTFRNVTGDTFTRATELAADLATVTGGSLQGAMTQLGKALEDPVTGINAMTRSGVSFTDQQKEMIKSLAESGDLLGAQTIILDELAGQYGGVARAEAEGFAGAQDTLAQSLQELRIAVGQFAGSGQMLVNWYNKASEVVQEFTAIIASGQINYYLQLVGHEFSELGKDIEYVFGLLTPMIEAAASDWTQSGESATSAIVDAFRNIVPNIRAFLQLAALEIIALADRAAVYGRAIAFNLNPKNWFSGESMGDFIEQENERINAIRLAMITDILNERDATIKAREEIISAGVRQREEWDRGRAAFDAFTPNVIAGLSDITHATIDAEKATEDYTSAIRSLQKALGDEFQRAAIQYQQHLETIAELEDAAAISAEESNAFRLAAFEQYQEKLTEIQRREQAARDRIDEDAERMRAMQNMQRLQAMEGFFGNLAYIAQQGGKESFEAYKALAMAEAGIAGALATIKALSAAPPPFNFMLAGAVGAATLTQMAVISGQTYQARENGGQVHAGGQYLVGERGPELLQLGGQGGSITPTSRISGDGVSVTNVFQVTTGVEKTVQAEFMSMMPMINEMTKQSIQQAVSGGGSMSRAVGRRS